MRENVLRVRKCRDSDGWYVRIVIDADFGGIRAEAEIRSASEGHAQEIAELWSRSMSRGAQFSLSRSPDCVRLAFFRDVQAEPVVWYLPPETSESDAFFVARSLCARN